jgi:hypothetical protein
MGSWVSLTGLLLVAAVLLCSEPGGAVAGKRNQKGSEFTNSRGGRVGHRRRHSRKGKKGKGKKTKPNNNVGKPKSKDRQNDGKFIHCDYIDLVEVGYRENSGCAPGGKFLFKVSILPLLPSWCSAVQYSAMQCSAVQCSVTQPSLQAAKGVRRQFLMTKETNIVLFLEQGKKVASCNNNFNDITADVKCKVRSAPTSLARLWMVS